MVRSTLPALALVGALAFPLGAFAAPDADVVPDGPEIAVVEPEAPAVPKAPDGIDFDEKVIFDQVYDDVWGGGETVEIRGPVGDNAFVMGREVVVEAPVSGDLFAAAELVRIRQSVAGDVYAMGADIELAPGATIGGDVFGLAGEITVEGPIAGSLNTAAGRVELASTVGGDADLSAGELVIGEGAQIFGDLAYAAPAETEGIDAIVGGGVTYTEATEDEIAAFEEPPPTALEAAMAWTGWRIWDYLSKLIVGAVLIALGGVASARVVRTLDEAPAASLGIGFLTLITLPVAAFLCVVTVIPMSLGFLGFLAWGVLLFVGQIVTAQWLGELMLGAARPEATPTPYAALAVGLIPVSIVFGIPWIAFLAVLTASLLGMGAIVKAMARRGATDEAGTFA